MKRINTTAILGFLFVLIFTSCNSYKVFVSNEIERKYILHIPKNLPPNAPLVFALHGYGNKAGFIKLYTDMNSLADKNGFAVVYPQGLKDNKGNTHWNADLTISKVDDVGFLTNLASHLQKSHDLNPQKTYVFGISNGGFMAYTLACKVPDKFAGIASIIGSIGGNTWDKRDSLALPVPVLQVSGLMDKRVLIDGSVIVAGGWSGAPHMDKVMEYWANKNKCTTTDTLNYSPEVNAFHYKGGVNDNQVWYYKIGNLKHTYPTKRKHGLRTSELIWEFFSQI